MSVVYLADKEKFKSCVGNFELKKIGYMVGNVFSSNIISLLGVLILKFMDISVFTPINSAFAILSGTIASVIIKEKISTMAIISVGLAVAAVII